MKKLLIPLIIVLMSGCTSTYKQEAIVKSTAKLVNGKSILISVPSNGSYEGKEYSGSGASTSQATYSAFARHSSKISIVETCKTADCLKSKSNISADYYVVPEILHWEDRNTEWSGIKDKMEVKITVYNAADMSELCSSIISGKSKWATFGGDHPQDLLPEPLKNYVESLY
jgi:hypothetical protein